MRARARLVLPGLLTSVTLVAAPATHAASFGVQEKNFEAGTCVNTTCTYKSVEEHPAEAFTQAAGHPPFGITSFEFNSETIVLAKKPVGAVKNIRVDVPPGLAADPVALSECKLAQFEENKCPASTRVGTNILTVYAAAVDESIEAPVYNLEPAEGLPLEFGIDVILPGELKHEHAFLLGHVSWHHEKLLEERGIPSGDYHEWFEITEVEKTIPVLKSKLIFEGTKAGENGYGNFLTLPSVCSETTTAYLEVESWEGQKATTETHTPAGVEHCDEVPFAPLAELVPEVSQSDEPDGAATVVNVKQNAGAEEINTADVKDVQVTLPEGLTLNPSAARGLEACTPAQIGIGSEEPVTCPAGSKVGTIEIETDLPPHSLQGNVYLGDPSGGPITGPPYTIYLDAESARFGVSVRLQGTVNPDPVTGRLETSFADNPQLPFSQATLKLNGGPLAPLANPLSCEASQVKALFTPYTGGTAALSASPFASSGCSSPLPFSLTASAAHAPSQAGAHTTFTFGLHREDGQQYLAHVSTTLPAGLVGTIPAVELCGEPQAATGTCPAGSRIGSANVAVGAGAEPYTFTGPVFLTGPYAGAPFGLSIAVPAVAGPFDLGTVVTRASVSVDPSTARVTVASPVPTIVGGVPLRLRSVTVVVERPGFLLNPTSCTEEAVETALASTLGAAQSISTPFATGSCGALAFSPSFSASTDAHTSKANGMSLRTTVIQPAGQANIRSVTVQLPQQASTRLTTIQQACLAATFAANPSSCPAGSNVGSATAVTPVLPGVMSGPAYLVSHGGEAFPDLDIVLEGSGVRVVLVGNTNIKAGVTRTTFPTLPDVPVSSFTLDLPAGPHSALSANGDLCASPLEMPTTMVAQNGAVLQHTTRVSVSGCTNTGGEAGASGRRLRILARRVRGHTLVLVVRTPAAGRLVVRGKYVKRVSKRVASARKVTVKVPLSRRALALLRSHHRVRVRVRVTLVPAQHGLAASAASTAVTFRR
jgi:hypothetical protein